MSEAAVLHYTLTDRASGPLRRLDREVRLLYRTLVPGSLAAETLPG